MIRALLSAHLVCAFGAVAMFWTASLTPKGGRVHRAVGRSFARLVYGAAATGSALALTGLARPAWIMRGSESEALQASTRHLMWLVLYMLLVIVAPVQHGLAAVAAGPSPAAVRSPVHLGLSLAAMAATLLLFPASLAWREWWFVTVAPAGFVVGLRNMSYASRLRADQRDWEREHLTSVLTAGVGLHTAWFVLSASRWPALANGSWLWAVWLGPAAVGLPVIWLLRRGRL